TPVYWVQEEPANMGAARYLQAKFGHRLLGRFDWSIIAREESASPATGFSGVHAKEQDALLRQAVPGRDTGRRDIGSAATRRRFGIFRNRSPSGGARASKES